MYQIVQLSFRTAHKLIVSDVNLTIMPQKFTVLLGENGAGKSTFLKLVAGLLPISEGQILLHQKKLQTYTVQELANYRAVLSQKTQLNLPFSVNEIVKIGRINAQSTEKQNQNIVDEILHQLKITHLQHQNYLRLSGGEQQKVQFARILAQLRIPTDLPKFLLLDEPTSHLDLFQQIDLLKLVKQLTHENIGIFAILHDINLAFRFADEIILMKKGTVLANGKADEMAHLDLLKQTYSIDFQKVENDYPIFLPII